MDLFLRAPLGTGQIQNIEPPERRLRGPKDVCERLKLPRFGGHPKRRDNTPGIVHGSKEAQVVFG